MAKSDQKLNKIVFEQLKGLKDLEIDFTEKPLVAIMGPNGTGKSTILHAIACVNNPVANPYETTNYKLSKFFTPTSHSIWQGSSYYVYQSYRDGISKKDNHKTHFKKQLDRWAPRYSSRIERYVVFIGIKTCVPRIEIETQQGRIRFNTTHLSDDLSRQVKDIAGYVMNRNYDEYNDHKTRANKHYMGVATESISYSSLSMGSGEQRIFYILSEVLRAPNSGLILIDEIDLLLHQDALFRLLEKLNERAQEKNLQIIFTTHAQSILELDFIAFRHIHQTSEKTFCFNKTTPDTLYRLTGRQERPFEVFVEDDLAAAIVKKICSENMMSKYVSIKEYGSIENSFTLASAIVIQKDNNEENILIVLDGDKYRNEEDKQKRIKKVLTGNLDVDDNKRALALSKMTQFIIPEGDKPEVYFHKLICGLNQDETDLTEEEKDIISAAKEIVNPGNSHKYFDNLIKRFDWERKEGLGKLVDLLSKTREWNDIKSTIQNWIDEKKKLIEEDENK